MDFDNLSERVKFALIAFVALVTIWFAVAQFFGWITSDNIEGKVSGQQVRIDR